MEYVDKETTLREKITFFAEQKLSAPLTDLQLALVGGGVGEIAVG